MLKRPWVRSGAFFFGLKCEPGAVRGRVGERERRAAKMVQGSARRPISNVKTCNYRCVVRWLFGPSPRLKDLG